MPRPKPSEPRDQTVLFRVSAPQRELLEAVAHLDRVTPNEYVHQLLVTTRNLRPSNGLLL
jgi:hypothetical protein